MTTVRKGQIWKENETPLHRQFSAEPRTVRVFELLADGRVRVRKLGGCGAKKTLTMNRQTLIEKYALLKESAK